MQEIQSKVSRTKFQPKKGFDYTKIFFLVVKLTTIRLVLCFVGAMNLHLIALDVNGYLEGIYMEQPKGFQVSSKEKYFYKLKKSLYGLKHAPR